MYEKAAHDMIDVLVKVHIEPGDREHERSIPAICVSDSQQDLIVQFDLGRRVEGNHRDFPGSRHDDIGGIRIPGTGN